MKLLPLPAILAAFVCLNAVPVLADLSTGLDAYWNFDETSGGTLYDSSAAGPGAFNGTLVNYANNQGDWTSGLFGNALQFGGPSTHQYVSVPNFAMPTTSMTLTAWVYADSLPPWATIAANWNGGYGAFNYATFGHTPNMSLYVADRQIQPGAINVDYGTSSVSLSTGQWHFLAFIANAQTDTITFMQDGSVTGSFGYFGQMIASSSQLNIGDDPSDTSAGQGNWDGKIDDMAIWTRALSSQELSTIYNAGLNGQPLMDLLPEPSAPMILAVGAIAWLAGRRRIAALLPFIPSRFRQKS